MSFGIQDQNERESRIKLALGRGFYMRKWIFVPVLNTLVGAALREFLLPLF